MNQRTELTAQAKVTREWDEMAGEWDDLAAGYARGLYSLLWETVGIDPVLLSVSTTRVIDFGCGTGLLTEKLRTVCAQVLAIDASTRMMQVVKEKIRSSEWENVQAVTAVLGQPEDGDATNTTDAAATRQILSDWRGTADLVVASSVMSFIPESDMEATMQAIARLLKPGGIFCHSDWPASEAKLPNESMWEDKAMQMYAMGQLKVQSIQIVTMNVGGGEAVEVFVGVACKE